jgi:hypothetical protein
VPIKAPSTFTCTLPIAVPTTVPLSTAQPDTVTVPETVAPATGWSIHTSGGPLFTVTVTLAAPASGTWSLSRAVTVITCCPGLTFPVFNVNVYPTFGHPGRPGYAPHTSGRLMPYVALPTTAPSNSTCTPLMAVPTPDVLS